MSAVMAASSDRRKVFFSYDQIHRAVESLVPAVKSFNPDAIVAIGGGGYIPARILRTHVRAPILGVSLELYNDATRTAGASVRRLQWLDDESEERVRGKRLLVVDEVDDSRATLAFCCSELLRSCSPAAIAVAVVHDKARPKVGELPAGVAHFAAETLAGDCWVCYPWDAAAYGLSIDEVDALASRPRLPVTRGRASAFRGSFLHAPGRGLGAELMEDAVVVVGADGAIDEVLLAGDPRRDEAAADHEARGSLTVLPPDVRVLPGFVDLHVHAPQWGQLGRALDRPLSEWLQTYTFPLEARFADEAYAARVYAELVGALLANGTTTAVYYASRHLPATRALAEACLRACQRALVGKVAMDDPAQCPDYYRDASAGVAIAETRALIEFVRAMPGNGGPPGEPPASSPPLVLPVITPRFIPSCSDELLSGLGALAAETGAHVQTHCSESDWEHAFALGRFGCTDTAALDRFGLLTRRTILGREWGQSRAARGGEVGVARHNPLRRLYRRKLRHGHRHRDHRRARLRRCALPAQQRPLRRLRLPPAPAARQRRAGRAGHGHCWGRVAVAARKRARGDVALDPGEF